MDLYIEFYVKFNHNVILKKWWILQVDICFENLAIVVTAFDKSLKGINPVL